MRRAIIVGASLALLAAAPASATPSVKMMRLAIQSTTIHVVDWHQQDAAYPDASRAWVQGHGTQTLGFSDRRPVTYIAVVVSGRGPGGIALKPLGLVPAKARKPLRASVRRTADWHISDGTQCDREGGCDYDPLVPPVHHKQSCDPKHVDVPVQLGVDQPSGRANTYRLSARFDPLNLEHLWESCPPDMDNVERPLTLAHLPAVAFGGAIAKVAHLKRGGNVTLEAEQRQGAVNAKTQTGCPKLKGPGLQECATTHVTLEVTRLR